MNSKTHPFAYTSRGYGCRFYSELIFIDSKALKQAHSKLCNWFSSAVIGENQPIENRRRGCAKYKRFIDQLMQRNKYFAQR